MDTLEEGIPINWTVYEGISERNIEIARNMLKKNIDIETISEITGLSKSEIKSLSLEND